MATQLGRYTDARIRKMLQDKAGYDVGEVDSVIDATRRRIKLQENLENRTLKDLKRHIKDLDGRGELNEELIADYFSIGDTGFLYEALAYKLKTNEAKIRKAIGMKKAEVICAVCWKAKLSARFAYRLQQELAGVKKSELLVPKGGEDYPLSEKDMKWHLKFLEIE